MTNHPGAGADTMLVMNQNASGQRHAAVQQPWAVALPERQNNCMTRHDNGEAAGIGLAASPGTKGLYST